jgi:hypothetical protein
MISTDHSEMGQHSAALFHTSVSLLAYSPWLAHCIPPRNLLVNPLSIQKRMVLSVSKMRAWPQDQVNEHGGLSWLGFEWGVMQVMRQVVRQRVKR